MKGLGVFYTETYFYIPFYYFPQSAGAAEYNNCIPAKG